MNQKIYNDLEEFSKDLQKEETGKIFLVTGKKSFEASGAKKKLKQIIERDNTTVFSNFSSNPKIEEIQEGIDICKKINPILFIAVGGGSVIDVAKLINFYKDCEKLVEIIKNNKMVNENVTKMVVVPTTSGSGSESTPFATFYIDGIKNSLESQKIIPSTVVLDSSLVLSLSKEQTAISGMDALCQAIESCWSIKSTKESREYALKAISLIYHNLVGATLNPSLKNKDQMMIASNLAGKAIAISKTTSCHSISYPITSRFNIPHGHAVSLTLGEILLYNYNLNDEDCDDPRGKEFVKNSIDEICRALETNSPLQAKKEIEKMMDQLNLKRKLRDLLINDIEIIIKEGFTLNRMKNNPRNITENDLREILEEIS